MIGAIKNIKPLLIFWIIVITSCTFNENREANFKKKVSSKDSINIFSKLDSANIFRIKGDLELAKTFAESARSKSESLNWGKGLAEASTNLAYVSLYENDFEAAMENAVKGLKVSEKIGDLRNQGFANLLIGYVYFSLGDTNQVLPYYNASLTIRKKLGNDYDIGYSYSYLGNYYLSSGKYDSALYYHKLALEHRLNTSDTRSIADSYLLIGSTYKSQQFYGESIRYFENALTMYQKIDDKKRLAETYRNFAEIYEAQGRLHDAKNYLLIADSLTKLTGALDNSILIADQLSKIEYKEGNYQKAYDYLRYHINKLNESSGESKYKNIVKNILEYKNEKEKKIKQLEYEQKAYQQRMVVVTVSILLILVAVFLFFVANRLKLTRKQKDLLAFRKNQVDKAFIELERKNKDILDSITYAKRIQSAILPSDELIESAFNESFVLYLPKDIVAGDFYWLEQKEEKLLFAACDCTGHGVPGAMVSVVCNTSLNRSIHEYGITQPSLILDKTRELVVNEFGKSSEDMMDGMDIALCCISRKENELILEYSGAHNPLWIIRKGSTEIEEYKADNQPIGKMEQTVPFTNHQIDIYKGDQLYLFSDGYKDQFGGERGKKLKSANFMELILSIKDFSMYQQQQMLLDAFHNWRGEIEQIDDVCVIGVRV